MKAFQSFRIQKILVAIFFSIHAYWGIGSAYAVTIYVDNTMDSHCTAGDYSIAKRACTGSDGIAYNTVQNALDAMRVGDTIVLRGGVYQEGHIRINYKKSGTSWKSGEYNTMRSHKGEWAVLDGQNGGGDGGPNGLRVGGDNKSACVLGHSIYPSVGQAHIKYWKFERLEIKNGATANGNNAAAFWGTGGPFIFRYCYIHHNEANAYNDNPSGLKGHVWHDSIIEYCYFINNGINTAENHHNAAHITIFSDYRPNQIARDGFVDKGHHTMKNIIRYNLFVGAPVAIKYKQCQLFTGRNQNGEHPLDDSYKTYGDNVHHNIIMSTTNLSIDARQDFIQVHHNIIDEGGSISIGEKDTRSIYKAVTYNNTIFAKMNGIWRIHSWWPEYGQDQTSNYYGYDFNNIVDNAEDGWTWSDIAVDTLKEFGGNKPNYDNYVNDRNLFYRPGKSYRRDSKGEQVIWLDDKRFTVKKFEEKFPGVKLFRKDLEKNEPFTGVQKDLINTKQGPHLFWMAL